MYSKIAIGNVKKSFKDYTVYFLTLTLAVCIFYSFNSIESQKAFADMQSSQGNSVKALTTILSSISVFVSVILGSLILYANNFLIKKRKKELGIYMTLGMGKKKISRILVMETLLVGVISLVSGIILGILASQGLSLFTAKMFEVNMSSYSFVISTAAIGKTILYFSIMFLLVMIFNAGVISKYKIIDLLTSGRKNEDIKFKNPIIYLFTFILCIVSLVAAYKIIFSIGLRPDNPLFFISTMLGIIGTILFFFSLAGFVLFIIKRSKKVYFKGLNIFVVKQLNSKVNTNFLSVSLICLLLFLTITVLSTGIGFKTTFEANLKKSTPFSATGTMYVGEKDKVKSIEDELNLIGFKFDNNEPHVFFNIYDSGLVSNDILDTNQNGSHRIYAIKLSDYNAIRKLDNKDPLTLSNDDVLIVSNVSSAISEINNYLNSNNKIIINDKNYIIKNKEAIEESIRTDATTNTLYMLVVNDEVANKLELSSSNFNVNFTGSDKEKSENKFAGLFDGYRNGKYDKSIMFVHGLTREEAMSENRGITTTVLFVGIYLGVVFLITSMAVLALQQLSEASDSIDRYKSLSKIGASKKMIDKTIFTQVLIYFTLPIALALIHSLVGIKVANDFIGVTNKSEVIVATTITILISLGVYMGYFYATYSGYKNIVKNNL